ncbi:uncharacterized protein BX664DRAFT_365071 [Halteromyces radiatus]|uniref:uncharacterized protein n=1 Tax=Halteromyces radiatus TaxID=101107 RepID=UPI00221F2444|nr:uncharacterized protein BX664DRAFT_365071 [Halteromyces radiatus]KAI8093676.1 hypothetical protein BX664DRAFT_365071 [Halteromyces radiatus]
MSLTPTVLLSSLKDFNKCNDDLSAAVKRTILEPLQSDMMMTTTAALREPLRRPIAPPGLLGNGRPQDIRTKVKQLAPLAMRVVNQNIDSLKHFKDWRRNSTESTKTINTIKHCLIDTSFYATTALQNMKPYSTLKPLDIEKTVSNLIGKLVDLGEWARALEELRKFRYHLASMERIQLDKTLTLNLTTGSLTVTQQRTFDTKEYSLSTSPTGSSDENNKDDQKESTHQHRLKTTPPTSPNRSLSPELVFVGGKPTSMSSWEEEMIQKYADLFTFPLNTNINDRSMILLVLAYQMNVIRSWCDVNDGILIKYIAILLDRPGNFIDWCKHLMSFDEVLAKKQFDLLQRHLSRTASKSAKFGKQ